MFDSNRFNCYDASSYLQGNGVSDTPLKGEIIAPKCMCVMVWFSFTIFQHKKRKFMSWSYPHRSLSPEKGFIIEIVFEPKLLNRISKTHESA